MTHSVECLEWHRNQNMHIQFCFNNIETDYNLYGYASVCHQIVIVKKKDLKPFRSELFAYYTDYL